MNPTATWIFWEKKKDPWTCLLPQSVTDKSEQDLGVGGESDQTYDLPAAVPQNLLGERNPLTATFFSKTAGGATRTPEIRSVDRLPGKKLLFLFIVIKTSKVIRFLISSYTALFLSFHIKNKCIFL